MKMSDGLKERKTEGRKEGKIKKIDKRKIKDCVTTKEC